MSHDEPDDAKLQPKPDAEAASGRTETPDAPRKIVTVEEERRSSSRVFRRPMKAPLPAGVRPPGCPVVDLNPALMLGAAWLILVVIMYLFMEPAPADHIAAAQSEIAPSEARQYVLKREAARAGRK